MNAIVLDIKNIKPNDIYYKEKWHKHPFQATQCVPWES